MGETAADRFRTVAGRFATGVTVVSTAAGETVHAMTVNAFASLSLDPLLVLVCLDRDATMHELLGRSGSFAVTVLARQQERLSLHFASSGRPQGHGQFEDVPWRPSPVSGAPLLEGGLAWMDCTVTAVHDGGDHSIFVGRVDDMGLGEPDEPLVFFAGGYRRLAEPTGEAPPRLEPGEST